MVPIIFEAADAKKGLVHKINVSENKLVKKGDLLVSIITQTMNYDISAPFDGIIKNVSIYENKVIDNNDELFAIEEIKYVAPDQEERVNVLEDTPTVTEAYREEVINKLLKRQHQSNGLLMSNDFDDEEAFDVKSGASNHQQPALSNDDQVYLAKMKNDIDALKDEIIAAKRALQNDLSSINEIKKIRDEEKKSEEVKIPTDKKKSSSKERNDLPDVEAKQPDLRKNSDLLYRLFVDNNLSNSNEQCEPEKVILKKEKFDFEPSDPLKWKDEADEKSLISPSKIPDDVKHDTTAEQQALRDEIDRKIEAFKTAQQQKRESDVNQNNYQGKPEVEKRIGNIVQDRMEYFKSLAKSTNSIPVGLIDVEVDVTELVNLLSIMREPYHQSGIDLNLMPFYAKATIESLQKFTVFNNGYNPIKNADEIIVNGECRLMLSYDSETGLKLPIIENIQNASVKEIAVQLNEVVKRLSHSEAMFENPQRATFTIMNFGEFGITRANLLIPENHTGALGAGIIFKRPVVIEKNNISIRDIMTLSLAYNQGLIDLGEASRFLHYVSYLLSNPGLLM